LTQHSWPGNVRELENVIERAVVLSQGELTESAVLLDERSETEGDGDLESLEQDRPTLEKLEERYIKKILHEVHHRIDDAARVLGISRRTLYRKERLWGMMGTTSVNNVLDDERTLN
jgi:DNA-binding NtrC family response regulator